MRSALALFFTIVAILAITAGCSGGGTTSGSGGGGGHDNVGSVVVGVTSEFRIGVDIDRLRVQMWVGDKVIKDHVLIAGSSDDPLKLPAESPFLDVEADEVVKVRLDAFGASDDKTPLVTRLASTHVIEKKKLLLHVELDPSCAVAPGSSAPSCEEPATCIAGACGDALADPK